jgi:hypothetical protein
MSVTEAINELAYHLDIVCSPEGTTAAKPETVMGDVQGGNRTITVLLRGDRQPERARTLVSLLGVALRSSVGPGEKCEIEKYQGLRGGKPDYETRIITIILPEAALDKFAHNVTTFRTLLEHSPRFKAQYRLADELLASHFNHPTIAGLYPQITLSAFGERGLHFELQVKGVPNLLADQVADILGEGALVAGNIKPWHVEGREYSTGKAMRLDMGHPRIDEAIEKIQTYVNAMRHVNKGGHSDLEPPTQR